TKRIVLALDSDIAGDMAARRGIVIAQKQGLEISVARFGKYKDPDDAVRADPKYFEKCIKEAIGVWDFLIDSVFEKNDIGSGEGKRKISNEIIPVLISIPDKIVQAHYIEIVSRRLGVPPEAVYEQIEEQKESIKKDKDEDKIVTFPNKPQKTRRQLIEERLLSLAFQGEPKVLLNEKILGLVQTPLTKRILEVYVEYIQKEKTFSSSKFTEKLPKELLDGYANMILKDLEGITEDPALLEKEMSVVIKELEILSIRHKLEKLGVKIRELEENKEFDKLVKFQEKFRELAGKLSKYEESSSRGIILQEI
ncbi:MAG: toprim domain-containing protein, partial [Patescibacteria group bacterium]